LKRLDETGEFRVTLADDATIERDVDKLMEFWTTKWAPKAITEPFRQSVRNHRTMLLASYRAGMLYMPTLWQGDRPLCLNGTLIDKERKALRFMIGGRDETFNSPPTGFMLHCHSIRWAIENGFKLYDFLQGNEPYKYMFGSEERYLKTIVVTTKSGE